MGVRAESGVSNFEWRLAVFNIMKIAVLMIVVLFSAVLAQAAMPDEIMKSRPDSVSYCLGYLSSRCLLRIDREKMQSAPDVIEYIEGLRESDLGKKTVITKKALYLWHTGLAGLFAEEKASAPEIPLSVPDMVDGLADGMWHRFRRMSLAESEEYIATHSADAMKCVSDTSVIKSYSYALGLRASREIGLDGDAGDYSAGVRFGSVTGAGRTVKNKSALSASPRGIGRFIGDNIDEIARRKGLQLKKALFIEGAKAALGLEPLLMPETEPESYIHRLYLRDLGR